MKPVGLHPDARRELDEAVDYYQSRRAGLGTAFRTEVKRLISVIGQTPDRFPVSEYTGFQKATVKKFPYNIFYENKNVIVFIIAVAHQKRKPGYWLSRT